MAYLVSPGVQVIERAIDNVIPAVTTNNGAFVGAFNWGPVSHIQYLSDENNLVNVFHKPTDSNYLDFFSAANFLAYTNSLYNVRVVGAAASTACASASIVIKNIDDYTTNFADGQLSSAGVFAAKYIGALGNSISFSIADSATYVTALTGTLDAVTSTKVLAGTGTSFTTQLEKGSIIKNVSGVVVGVIDTITSNVLATFVANTAVNITAGTGTSTWKYASLFPAPSTSAYALSRGGLRDEMHMVVVDAGGLFTGVKDQIIKTFAFVSKAKDAKNSDGTSNYYADVMNRQSDKLWWLAHPTGTTNWGHTSTDTTFDSLIKPNSARLSNGTDAAPVDADIIAGWNLFSNSENVDISLAITGAASTAVQQYVIQNIAEVRKDVVAFVSPSINSVVNNVGNEASSVVTDRNALPSSSYAFMDSGWKYQYDRYNDKYRWMPLNPDTAGLAAAVNYYFESFAGVTKGQIKNVERLAWVPKQNERDILYLVGVNSVVTMRGQGTYLYGDKTLLARPSSFDRINVRRLFIGLEKSIATSAKYSLFQFNDAFTQARFKNTTEPFLRTVQGLRGITDFRVICDSSNNTPDIVSSNQFVGTIMIKPNMSINFITLNFSSIGANVTFEQLGA